MWIEDFRRAHGLTLEDLGAYIRRLGGKRHPPIKVSDTLLERLEGEPKFRTVPAIADLIAEACGATAQQRDRLVLEKDLGTWKPRPGRKPTPKPKAPVEEEPEPKNDGHHHPVVAVDRAGFAVMRFAGVKNAAARCGVSHKMVYSRCLRQLGRDEFRALGFTFRYAEEWDRMTDAERRADMAGRRTGETGETTGTSSAPDGAPVHGPAGPVSLETAHSAVSRALDAPEGEGLGETKGTGETKAQEARHVHYQRGVVAVDRQGREVARWDMVKHAHVDTGVAESTISKSIQGRRNAPYVRGVDLAFVAAEEWDDMTEAQRRARLGLD